MKTLQIARGIAGVLSLAGVMGLVGCGAETGEQGAQIGSSEQALGLTLTQSGKYDVKFPAYIKISSTEVLLAGGYDPSTGNAVTTIKKGTYNSATSTFTWSNILDANNNAIALPVASGEAEITDLGSNKLLYTGGRAADGSATVRSTGYIITLGASPSVGSAINMTASHVNHKVVPCGSQYLVIGGDNGSGASDVLEVFTPSSPAFAVMKNKLSPFSTITLTAARAFHEALSISSTKVIAFGGEDLTGTLRATTEVMTVDASCNLDVGNNATVHPAAGGNLPAARTKAVAWVLNTPITPSGSSTTYEAIMAGGEDASTAPTTTFLYDSGTNNWTSTNTPSLNAGHSRPIFAREGASVGDVALVGGLNGPNSASLDVSLSSTDKFIDSTSSFSAGTTMLVTRYAGWAAYIGATPTYIAAQGVSRVFNNPTYTETSRPDAE